ncbi:hypothetical protein ERO13_A11G236900v2 [Gossypium hirsutum]|nr:hypothetical protein ERO13_A11G236900v2 [Gossypium hirsutum]
MGLSIQTPATFDCGGNQSTREEVNEVEVFHFGARELGVVRPRALDVLTRHVGSSAHCC